MKANELMIGDWVYNSPHSRFPMRVTLIDEGGCYLNFEGNEGDPFDGDFGENGIQPIPVTEKILAANGIKKVLDYEDVNYFHFGESSVRYSKKKKIYNMRGVSFRFVHEFQYLLRLCGYEDLADNFKIK